MRQDNIIIRRETPADYAAVEHLTREAFWNVYRPGCLEHYVVHVLRRDPDFVPELDLVMERARELGAGALCIEGNIDFYGKSGFVVAGTRGVRYHGEPEQEIVPYVLLRELQPDFLKGVTGVYHTPKGYYVDEAAAEEFDRNFPPKEKLRLPGQLF